MKQGMVSRFWRRIGGKPVEEVAFPPVSPDEDFIAVGDIHGRYDLMQRLLARLSEHRELDRLVFLGDYIDRGEQSAEVLKGLHWLDGRSGRAVCLRGNHEEMLLAFLEDPLAKGPDWLRHGGRQTLQSFGVFPVPPSAPAADWLAARDSLARAMGADMIGWLQQLPVIWQTGNIVAVHAGLDPAKPVAAQSESDLVWGHPEFLQTPRQDGVWVIHGHTIVDQVIPGKGRIGVDTGAFATGKLSAVVVGRGVLEVFEA